MPTNQKNWLELPDFRNLSIIIVLVVILLLLVFILAGISYFKFGNYLYYLTEILTWFIPATLTNIIILMALNNQIQSLRTNVTWSFIIINTMYYVFYLALANYNSFVIIYFILINIFYLFFLRYYTIRKQSLMPALIESKLIALTSAIRPHFLFNSINTAISLVKTQPNKAEEVLQNMADLFRAIFKKNNHSTLKEELELVQAYIDIEKIRLGEDRLKIIWQIDAPDSTITPYLFLQPLLENAIYHGIENLIEPEPIIVNITKQGNWIYIKIKNPIYSNIENISKLTHNSGYKITLENLQERLTLMFAKDATFQCENTGQHFLVKIRLPYYTRFNLR